MTARKLCPTKLLYAQTSTATHQTAHINTHKPRRHISTPRISMSGSIPTSTFVSESAVIEAPFSDVWHLIKLQDFSKFWSKLDRSEVVKGVSEETDIVKWTFKDGTVLEVKQEEHSVSSKRLYVFS